MDGHAAFSKSLFTPPEHQRRPAGYGGSRRADVRTRVVPNKITGTPKKRKWQAPKPAKGAYVNAPNNPHWSHNLANGRFWANAMVNNKGNALAGGALGGAAVAESQRKKLSPEHKRDLDTVAGGAAVGGATQFHGTRKLYQKVRDYQKPENNMDWAADGRNRYAADMPKARKKEFDRLKSDARKVAGGVDPKTGKVRNMRRFAEHYNANFPEGYKTSEIRRAVGSGKAMSRVNRNALVAGVVGGGAIYGGEKLHDKVKKSHEVSAFGVDHG